MIKNINKKLLMLGMSTFVIADTLSGCAKTEVKNEKKIEAIHDDKLVNNNDSIKQSVDSYLNSKKNSGSGLMISFDCRDYYDAIGIDYSEFIHNTNNNTEYLKYNNIDANAIYIYFETQTNKLLSVEYLYSDKIEYAINEIADKVSYNFKSDQNIEPKISIRNYIENKINDESGLRISIDGQNCYPVVAVEYSDFMKNTIDNEEYAEYENNDADETYMYFTPDHNPKLLSVEYWYNNKVKYDVNEIVYKDCWTIDSNQKILSK